MTSEVEGHFLWLPEALTRFKATRSEVLAHCEAGEIAAVYVSEEGPNGIRVCVEDMRKWFQEVGSPEETNKKSTFGKVLRWTGGAVGTAAAAKLVDNAWPTIEHAWHFLSEHIFRSLPEPRRQLVQQESGAAAAPATTPPGATDRAMRAGRDYVTREGPGPGARTTGLAGGSHPGGPARSDTPRDGGFTTRDGGHGGWRTK